jgi:4-amino-4-deoxy-L-arabinose transferase-like glycosyltransferase
MKEGSWVDAEEGSSGLHARALGWPLLFAAVALALNVAFYSGYYMSDDASYLDGIQRLAAGDALTASSLAHVRLLINYPASLVQRLFGSATITILSFCLYHPAVVLLSYLAGCLAFDRRSALLGCAFVAASPVLYFYGGAILPDNALTFWCCALTCGVLWAAREAGRGNLSVPQEALAWGACGFLTGLAYMAKEPGLVMAAPALATIVLTPRPRSRLVRALLGGVTFVFGLAFVFGLEALALRFSTGDWVVRLLSGVGSASSVDVLLERVKRQGTSPIDRIAFWYEHARIFYGGGLAIWLAVAANVAAWFFLWRRARTSLSIACAFWIWPFVYLTFGTTNFSRYLPPPIQHARYYAVCTPLCFVVVAAALMHAARYFEARSAQASLPLRRALRATPYAVVAVTAVVMFLAVAPDAGTIYHALETRAFRAALQDGRSQHPQHPVLLSRHFSARLGPLLGDLACSPCAPLLPYRPVKSVADLPPRPFLALFGAPRKTDPLENVLRRYAKAGQLELRPPAGRKYKAPADLRTRARAQMFSLTSKLGLADWGGSGRKRKAQVARLVEVVDRPTR